MDVEKKLLQNLQNREMRLFIHHALMSGFWRNKFWEMSFNLNLMTTP
jgi:hypothetical protein